MRSGALLVGVVVLVAVLAGAILLSDREQPTTSPSLPSQLADEPRQRAAAQATVERFATAYGRFVTGHAAVEDLRRAGASAALARRLQRSTERVPPGLASAHLTPRDSDVFGDPADPGRMVGNITLVDQHGTRLPLSFVLGRRAGGWEILDLLAGGDDL